MKFLQFAALIAGSSAIRMNTAPVSHVVIHSNYHDDYDSVPMPNRSEIAAAKENGTLTASGTISNESSCSTFQNGTLDELETNFTALFNNFTGARASVSLKAGNQTLNASSNPNFVNASLFTADQLTNLTKHMKPLHEFMGKYKAKLLKDGDISDLNDNLDDLAAKNISAVKKFVNYTAKILVETPMLVYVTTNFTDEKLNNATTVVQTNVTSNASVMANASANATAGLPVNDTLIANTTIVQVSVVSEEITSALNNLSHWAEKFKNLDPATYHNVNLAWTKQYQCNGTMKARAAALNATKNHTHANRSTITSTTCSANHTRELNETATAAAAAAVQVIQTRLHTPVNAKPAVIKIEIQA
jgi:hypothetical protein